MDRWVDKVAIVTGASCGIGAQTAIDLANAGVKVVGLARRVERIEHLKSQVTPNYQKNLYARKCDVGNEDSVKEAFHWIEKKLGGVHIMVRNAGNQAVTNIVDRDNTELLKDVVDTNLWGTVFCTREAFQSMKRYNINDGHIFLINGLMGHYVPNTGNIYARSFNLISPMKHAMTSLTEVVRRELRDTGTKIKITSISPGLVKTEIFTEHQQNVFANLPMLNPSDISSGILYALSTPPHTQIHEMIIRPVGDVF